MPYRKITPEVYDAMLRAYREQGQSINHTAVGRSAGVDMMTAKRAYERGWPKQQFRPVSLVLAEEMVGRRASRANDLVAAARKRATRLLADARMEAERQVAALMVHAEEEMGRKLQAAEEEGGERLAQAEREAESRLAQAEQQAQDKVARVYERMRLDAAEQTAEEVLLSKSARKNTLQAHGFMALAWANARSIAEQLRAVVDGKQLTPKQLMVLMREMTTANRNVVQASKAAVELERLRVGEPTEHLKVTVEAATLDEAERSVQQASDLIALARRRQASNGHAGGEEDPPDVH